MSHLHLTPENPSLSSSYYYFFADLSLSLSLCFGISNGLAQRITAQFTLNLDLRFSQRKKKDLGCDQFSLQFSCQRQRESLSSQCMKCGSGIGTGTALSRSNHMQNIYENETMADLWLRIFNRWVSMNDIQLQGIPFSYQESKKENWENKNKNLFGYHKKNLKK